MSAWAAHIGITLGQSVLLATALWSWAAFCATAATKLMSRRADYVTTSNRAVLLSAVSSVLLVSSETVALYASQHAELLGIHHLSLSPPYLWEAWMAILIAQPIASAAKLLRYRSLLQEESRWKGAPVRIEPRWVALLQELGSVILDWSAYVG
jgi:hypothetical protein